MLKQQQVPHLLEMIPAEFQYLFIHYSTHKTIDLNLEIHAHSITLILYSRLNEVFT